MAWTRKRSAAVNIAQAIREYLKAHPQAVDTERGIREWWLRDGQTCPSARDVRAALEHLVAAGEMVVLSLPDGQRAYGGAKGTEPADRGSLDGT